MLEDIEGISASLKVTDVGHDSLSSAEVAYVSECVEEITPQHSLTVLMSYHLFNRPKGLTVIMSLLN